MTAKLEVVGGEQFTKLARDLRMAGDEGKGLRLALVKQLKIIAKPMLQDVQRNAFNIPARGPKSTGLRVALMRAARTKVSMNVKGASMKVIVDPSKLPAGQQNLLGPMEGSVKWRHPVFGDTDNWVSQDSHPFVGPAADAHQNDAQIAASAAVEETIAKLEKGEFVP